MYLRKLFSENPKQTNATTDMIWFQVLCVFHEIFEFVFIESCAAPFVEHLLSYTTSETKKSLL